MRAFRDYDSTKTLPQNEQLPPDGYILKVLSVKYQPAEKAEQSDQIIISFDIDSGDYAGFYKRNYQNQTGEDKKWKGNFRIWVPNDDGSEKDAFTKRRFKTVITAFEESNAGFHWDWDEQKLKGKQIGGVFNQKEYDFNGRTGFFTQCKFLTTVEQIAKRTYKQPDTDYLKNRPASTTDPDDFMKIPDDIDDDELPFR